MRVLLVEDDQELGDGVKKGLHLNGFNVDWLTDGERALQALQTENFDFVILDLGLPGMTGEEILFQIRQAGKGTPVLILTARDTVEDCVKLLDAGADDYMTKPVDINELSARIRALHRRKTQRSEPTIVYGDIELDPAAHRVTYKGDIVNIPRREFALLQKLLAHQGQVLSREQLMQSIYTWEHDVDSNALEVHIHNLRKKLHADFIRTIRGVGYMVEKPKS